MASIVHDMLNPWSASKIPMLTGKVAVVTGGNEGIAAAFITELFKHDLAKAIILSNDKERYPAAVEHFSKEAGHDVSSKVIFHEMDLGDYDSVKKAVEQIKKETDRVDILNCSAAIGMYETDVPTSTMDKKHGLDRHFACNNIGHAILTQGLLPLIKKTADQTHDARIVIMSSNLHFSAPSDVKFASIEEINTTLGPTLQYNRSKLGIVLYTKKLARQFKAEGYGDKIFVNAIHPGVVKTAQQDGALDSYQKIAHEKLGDGVLGNIASSALAGTNYAMRVLLEKDSPEGALSALYAATAEEVKEKKTSGEYIVPNGTIQQADKRTLDESFQDRYYNLVQEIIQKDLQNVQGADHQDSTTRGFATI